MNIVSISLLILTSFFILIIQKRMITLPILAAACYIIYGQMINIGGFNFNAVRILIFVGLIRIILRKESFVGNLNQFDYLIMLSGLWTLFSSLFHNDVSDALKYRMGFFYDTCGIYFLFRVFIGKLEEIKEFYRIIAFMLIPVAILMGYEKISGINIIGIIQDIDISPALREEKFRAQGPFAHAIIAGTVGAVSIPYMVALYWRNFKTSLAGLIACFVMIITSTSSGPILSAICATLSLAAWRFRSKTHYVYRICLIGYVILELIMNAPAYYLLSRIDITGGSTGWHRSRLIEVAISNLSEWWFAGTDYTAHWMPYGVPYSPDHIDITNHYIRLGVISGLITVIFFLITFYLSFKVIAEAVKKFDNLGFSFADQFIYWALGCSLFTHLITMTSISYHDQSYIFLYSAFAIVSNINEILKNYTVRDIRN